MMEELLVMVFGGIGFLIAPALIEAIGEALGELFGAIFGAVAEACGEAVAAVGGAVFGAIAEAGGETVAAIGDSGTDAGMASLEAASAESGAGSGRIGRFLAVNAAANYASNRSSSDSSEPAPATLSYRDEQELKTFENGVNPYHW